MFGLFDVVRLLMSALVVLPITSVLRESGYYLAATILGAKDKKLIIGSGPILFTLPTIEVRRYFFMYSWMEYEELQPSNRFWHAVIYASPIINPLIAGFVVNSLLAQDVLPGELFWNTFLFYIFYYVLFDILPVYLPDGQPTNGRAIFDLIWHGERSDFLKKTDGSEQSNSINQDEQNESQDRNQGYTEAQEETMENRDRDQQERGDHSEPEAQYVTGKDQDNEQGNTKAQEKTIENQDRDQQKRGDHSEPDKNKIMDV